MINQMLPGMPKSEDLEFIQCGREQCRPGHSYGPAVRDHYLVHYVFKGKGRFYMGGKEYEIAQGGGFFIPPLTRTYYQADSETPWEYAWFGVNGSRAKGLYESVGVCEANPVFFCPEAATHFADIARGENPYATLSSVYGFFSCLFSLQDAKQPAMKPAQHYVFVAKSFLNANYARPVCISDLAKSIGLDRSYFSKIFKQATGLSPQNYLIKIRMEKAANLLKTTNISIGDVARSVGYADNLLFSRMFKKEKNVSPSQWREYFVKSH